MKNIFLIDLKNCIEGIKFKLGFLILLGISILGGIFTVLSQGGKALIDLEETGRLVFFVGNSVTKLVHLLLIITPLIVVLAYSDSFIKERDSGIIKSLFIRVGKKKIILSKLLVVALVSFFMTFIALGVQLLIIYISIQDIGRGMEGGLYYQQFFNYIETDFLVNLKYQNINLYNFCMLFVNAILNMLIAVTAYSVSLVIRLKRLSLIALSFIAVIIWDMLVSTLGIDLLNIYGYQQGLYGNIQGFVILILLFVFIIGINIVIGLRKDLI